MYVLIRRARQVRDWSLTWLLGRPAAAKARTLCRNQSTSSASAAAKTLLTKQKRSLAAFHREVAQAVQNLQKLRVPARNTVALRSPASTTRKIARRREGQDAPPCRCRR